MLEHAGGRKHGNLNGPMVFSQYQTILEVGTRGRALYEITSEVSQELRRSGLDEGMLHLMVRHTSASLLIQENADPDVRVDLERFFSRLCPDGDALYTHTMEGPDDMPAHVRSALTAVQLSIPFSNRSMLLGTWQGIYLWEHPHPHRRQIVLHAQGVTQASNEVCLVFNWRDFSSHHHLPLVPDDWGRCQPQEKL